MKAILIIIVILSLAIFFRIYNIGYSTFQGDEAVIVDLTSLTFQDFAFTLKSQLKGPGQYLVAYLAQYINSPNAELAFRLPFVLASILYTLIFTYIAYKINKKNYYIACIVFLFSGLIIGLSRIVQYQSFVILFTCINVLMYKLYVEKHKIIWIFLIAIFSIVGGLFHFDALVVVFAIFISLVKLKRYKDSIILAFSILIGYLTTWLSIYPISSLKTMLSYIVESRISQGSTIESLIFSARLMMLYHPTEFLIVSGALVIFYFVMLLRNSLSTEDSEHKNHFEVFINIYFFTVFIFYFLIMQKPLTHIYNIILPLSFLAMYGFKYLSKYLRVITTSIMVISVLSFNYFVFIDPTYEYPFEDDYHIFGKLSSIDKLKKLEGIFGFLYKRDYNKIKQDIQAYNPNIKNFESNEKAKITNYYLKSFNRKAQAPYYYIYIQNPQSQEYDLQNLDNLVVRGNRYYIYLIQ